MAMKDWKLESKNVLHTQWRRKDGKGGVFVSNKKTEAVEYNSNVLKEGYLASGFIDSLDNEERKVFKTRSQAVSFARSYMRTH